MEYYWTNLAMELWGIMYCTVVTTQHYRALWTSGNYGDPITGDFTTKLPALCFLHRTEEYCGFFLMFYIPENTNQSAFDFFILVDDILYIFQMTVKPIHDINCGLIDSADHYHFPPRAKWCFVFIIPPNLVLAVSQLWKLAVWSLSPFLVVVAAEMAENQWFLFVLCFTGRCKSSGSYTIIVLCFIDNCV